MQIKCRPIGVGWLGSRVVSTDQLQPCGDADGMIEVFARQSADWLVKLEVFHAYVALHLRIYQQFTHTQCLGR